MILRVIGVRMQWLWSGGKKAGWRVKSGVVRNEQKEDTMSMSMSNVRVCRESQRSISVVEVQEQ